MSICSDYPEQLSLGKPVLNQTAASLGRDLAFSHETLNLFISLLTRQYIIQKLRYFVINELCPIALENVVGAIYVPSKLRIHIIFV